MCFKILFVNMYTMFQKCGFNKKKSFKFAGVILNTPTQDSETITIFFIYSKICFDVPYVERLLLYAW